MLLQPRPCESGKQNRHSPATAKGIARIIRLSEIMEALQSARRRVVRSILLIRTALRKKRERLASRSNLFPSGDRSILDLNAWSRDRDRAVERSPALEFLNQLLCILGCNPLQLKLEADGVEQR